MVQNNMFKGTGYANFSENTLLNARKAGLCLHNVSNITAEENTIENTEQRAFCYHFVNTRDVYVNDSKCEGKKEDAVRSKEDAEFIYED